MGRRGYVKGSSCCENAQMDEIVGREAPECSDQVLTFPRVKQHSDKGIAARRQHVDRYEFGHCTIH